MVTEPKTINFPIEDALIKTYQLRWSLPGPKRKSLGVEVAVPRDFIKALARKHGVPYEEFVERCHVDIYFSGIGDTLLYKFELNGKESVDGNSDPG